MSIRTSAFKAFEAAPFLGNKFYLVFKWLSIYTLRVYSTSIPFPEILSASYYVRGRKYSFPVRKRMEGSWSFDVYEDNYSTFMSMVGAQINNGGSDMKSAGMSAVDNLKSLSQIRHSLDIDSMSDRFSTVTFDNVVLLSTTSSGPDIPTHGVVFKHLYIENVQPVQLSASNAESPVAVHVSCHYNGLLTV